MDLSFATMALIVSTIKHLSSAATAISPFRIGRSRLSFVAGALVLVSGCARESVDPAIAEGRSLYEANCLSCHGENALGDGEVASTLPVAPPSLMDHLGHHTEAQLIQLIKAGVPPAMPPTPLEDEEISLIVDYLWTLVPESDVEALRAMQQQMESMGDSAAGSMPGMQGMPGMPGMTAPPESIPAGMGSMHMQHGAGAGAGAAPR